MYVTCKIDMDTWISQGQPLMTLPISYLDIDSLGKWRHASKENINTTRAFTNMNWLEYASKKVHIHKCKICNCNRKINSMFHCSGCSQKVCGDHVCACNYCDQLLCSNCVDDCRSCWQTCGSC